MSDFVTQASEFAKQGGGIAWLQDYRQTAEASWQKQSMPTRKTEDWKYTSVRRLVDGNFLARPSTEAIDTDIAKAKTQVAGLTSHRLVFVNGQFSQALSSDLQDLDFQLTRFADADEIQKGIIAEHLGSVVSNDAHIFAGLNGSELNDGVLVFVPKNRQVETPIQIVHLTSAQAEQFTVQQRLLVVVEHNASIQVIEQFVSTEEEQTSFTNGITEVVLKENARLKHYRLNMEQQDALHVGGVHVNQAAHSVFDSFMLGMGGILKRTDVVVNHLGSGSHCELKGVYLPKNKQQIDYHTNIEHQVPHCTTNEVFRGIMADESKAVFNGRIHIHQDAQKTLAELSNKNLLLSNKAEINTKPELEIYADDVRCAHGATVSQIEEKALYYMQSRGISRKEAEVMLSFGFINELINELELAPLQELLRPVLANLFSQDDQLTRHLV